MCLERQGHYSRVCTRYTLWRVVSFDCYAIRWILIISYSNRQSSLSSLTPYLPLPKYFDSEWSYAQFRIPTQSSHISLSQQTSQHRSNTDLVGEEKCTVGWIRHVSSEDITQPGSASTVEHQLIALTFNGGWYRLSVPRGTSSSSTPGASSRSAIPTSRSPPSVKSLHIPRPRSGSGSSFSSRADKGKGRESDREKESRDCVLQEFRRFGRWDGWS